MVSAILDDGRKSQTRRLVDFGKGPFKLSAYWPVMELARDGMPIFWSNKPSQQIRDSDYYDNGKPCPYGKIGDRLWVRETWKVTGRYCAGQWEQCVEYRADHSHSSTFRDADHWNAAKSWAMRRKTGGWGTPIHMPRWASRILLEITSIGCERLQDITPQDVFAEGVQIPVTPEGNLIIDVSTKVKAADYVPDGFFAGLRTLPIEGKRYDTWVKAHYAALWDSINGVGSWAKNEFVWKICFKRVA